jgi:DNA-binding NtrC family response regulator
MITDPHSAPCLIFIVEDNVVYAKVLELFLKNRFSGATVKIFAEGGSVMEILDQQKPDFIIMDYYLDGSHPDAPTGLTISREIKSRNPDMKIFMLSGQQDIKIALAVKEAGCLYLVKNEAAFQNLEELIVRDLREKYKK